MNGVTMGEVRAWDQRPEHQVTCCPNGGHIKGREGALSRHNPKYQLLGSKRSMVVLMCAFPESFITNLEQHYSKYRHTEAAIGCHNLTDELLRPGTVRVKDKTDDKNIWLGIRTVTQDAVDNWQIRVLGDFETLAPPKSTPKKKKDAQPTSESLGDMMDKSCVYTWLMDSTEEHIKIRKVLSGIKLQKFVSMWSKGHRKHTQQSSIAYEKGMT
jgi:hypothetical protein